jgi:two-component system chemotaxis sensor kinase CheA
MAEHGPVLVVDDDPDIRELMERLFETSGHAATTAANGEEAIRRLREGLLPCLIILDLEMPVKDGFTFRREQLADPRLARIPVIICSSRHDAADIARHLQAAAHFAKSESFDALIPLIAAHCYQPSRSC